MGGKELSREQLIEAVERMELSKFIINQKIFNTLSNAKLSASEFESILKIEQLKASDNL